MNIKIIKSVANVLTIVSALTSLGAGMVNNKLEEKLIKKAAEEAVKTAMKS